MQQHHIFVPRIALDMAIELTDRHAPALDRLQKNAAAVAQDAGDATFGVM